MKLAPLLLACAAVIAVFYAIAPAIPGTKEPAPLSTRARTRLPAKDAPFWSSAVAPEPAAFREPTAVRTSSPVVPSADHPAEVARLFGEKDFPALNSVLVRWFEADPSAARDWLAARESLQPYQAALAGIAGQIAQAGDPAHALEWAGLLENGSAREQALFDIYAGAARFHQFTEEQLRAAPLPPGRIDQLLGGIADD